MIAPRSLYARTTPNIPFAETAALRSSRGSTMMWLVRMLPWRSWPGRGNGSGVLDPVSTSVPECFIVVVSFYTLLSGCSAMVERVAGCDNMTCRCGM